MMLSVYRVSSANFIEVPNVNTFVIFQLSTDNLFYAKVNNNGVISVVALGSGGGISTGNIIIPVGEGNQALTSNDVSLYAIQLSNDTIYSSVSFPNLTDINFIILNTNINLQGTVNFPSLSTVGVIVIALCDEIVAINFTDLTLADRVEIMQNQNLTNVNLSSLSSVTKLRIAGNENLVNIPSSGNINCIDVNMADNALDVITVNDLLISLDVSGAVNGVCELGGGTNAAPAGGGAAAVLSLQGKGWTVNTN